jgi:hypothetical protein
MAGYKENAWCSYRDQGDGEELMANFTARIVKETRYVTGTKTETVFTVRGWQPPPEDEVSTSEPKQLPDVDVPAESFGSLGWVASAWGAGCVIMPGTSVKDDLRTMIQLLSRPEVETVYRQTGWMQVGGKRTYLHVGGGVQAGGNDPSIRVQLPNELRLYNLISPSKAKPQDAFFASLALTELGSASVMWPLWAATFAPLFGPCDFAVHVTGRTGSFKSELSSLFQSHYGAGMDARHLPASWRSTVNANEALAFFACNAVIVLDDFVPNGSSYQQRQYQANADAIIRAQGNQAGRARLTDVSALQTTMYPRGLILSTGEDTPEGHSVRARMLIREIAAGDIKPEDLTKAQQQRDAYPAAVMWCCQRLAAKPIDLTQRVKEIRDTMLDIGHSRTPGMVARLIATVQGVFSLAAADGFVNAKAAAVYVKKATDAITAAGEEQASFLEDSDPVEQFVATVRQVLASGGGYFRTLKGGTPVNAELLGWSKSREVGSVQTYSPRSSTQLGWVKPHANELYLDSEAGYNVVKKAAGQNLSLSKMTLLKRLKEGGLITRVDAGRSRNVIRLNAEGHPRNVVCLMLSRILDLTEVDGEDQSSGSDDGGED